MLVSLWCAENASPFLLTAHASAAKKDKVRDSEWGEWDDVLTWVYFVLLYCPLLSPSSVFLFSCTFQKGDRTEPEGQAPVTFTMILKNGEIKARWPCSLTYIMFIQAYLALLLNLVVHGILNTMQMKRILTKTQ